MKIFKTGGFTSASLFFWQTTLRFEFNMSINNPALALSRMVFLVNKVYRQDVKTLLFPRKVCVYCTKVVILCRFSGINQFLYK
jgi:hypothetical protein